MQLVSCLYLILVRKIKALLFVCIYQRNDTIEMTERKGRREGGRDGRKEGRKERKRREKQARVRETQSISNHNASKLVGCHEPKSYGIMMHY